MVLRRTECGAPRVELRRGRAHHDQRRRSEQLVERVQQRRVALGVAPDRVEPGAHRALGRVEIALLAEQVPELDEDARRDPVAGWDRFVREGLRLVDQRFVIVGGEVEAAALVLEMREQRVDELAREVEVAAAPAALQQLEQAVREERVVVEIRREARAAVLVRRLEAAAAPELGADEIHGARRGVGEVGACERARGAREPRDHQSVPRDEHLLVAARPDALLACGEKLSRARSRAARPRAAASMPSAAAAASGAAATCRCQK